MNPFLILMLGAALLLLYTAIKEPGGTSPFKVLTGIIPVLNAKKG